MEWIVTMVPHRDRDLPCLVEVEGDDVYAAISNAFFTRNIATSWTVVEIIGDIPTSHVNDMVLPLNYYGWQEWARRN